jgi:hypothetical protein
MAAQVHRDRDQNCDTLRHVAAAIGIASLSRALREFAIRIRVIRESAPAHLPAHAGGASVCNAGPT